MLIGCGIAFVPVYFAEKKPLALDGGHEVERFTSSEPFASRADLLDAPADRPQTCLAWDAFRSVSSSASL
jgi:hypothetical protein